MSDSAVFSEMFNYLSKPDPLAEADAAVIFGRASTLPVDKFLQLYRSKMVKYGIVTGGIGKDSGRLVELNQKLNVFVRDQLLNTEKTREAIKAVGDLNLNIDTEAVFLANLLAVVHGIPEDRIILELYAKNGAQNCTFSLNKIEGASFINRDKIIVIAHATSLRRLAANFQLELDEKNWQETRIVKVPTDYLFDPESEIDQKEAVLEMIRLKEWPQHDPQWCTAQPDLPEDLVKIAYEVNKEKGW
jgi:uncharacterized SAM-binding protein YcdF (DUF218 family)